MQDLHPKTAKVLGRRNWCEVEELPTVPVPSIKSINPREHTSQKTNRMSGILEYSLRVEDPDNKTATPQVFVTPVPPYIPPTTYEGEQSSKFCRSFHFICLEAQISWSQTWHAWQLECYVLEEKVETLLADIELRPLGPIAQLLCAWYP